MATTTDGTYFVGRNELLSWINSTLSLGLTKIEQVRLGGRREEEKEKEEGVGASLSFHPRIFSLWKHHALFHCLSLFSLLPRQERSGAFREFRRQKEAERRKEER